MTSTTRLSVAGAIATLLATLCLWPAFRTADWFAATLWTVAVTVAACEVSRRFAVTRPMAPLIGLLTLVVSLTVGFAQDAALWGFIPTYGVLETARDLLTAAHEEVTNNSAPIAVSSGLTFLTAAGVGLVALTVDILAVSLRRAALAGLPLLALYSVPAAVLPEGVGWFSFVVGAAGYLLLLLTEARERVSRWGRPLDGTSRGGNRETTLAATSPLNAVGRRVGVAAVGLAVLLPVIAPGLDDGVLGGTGKGTGSGGGGSRTVQVVNPILDLRDDLQQADPVDILEYTTDDTTPGYVRLVSLDEFTGDQWQPTRLQVPERQNVNDGFPDPVGLSPDVAYDEITSTFTVYDYDDRWLPLPFPAQQVDVEGTWLYDVPTWNVFSSRNSTQGLTYTVRSLDVQPTPEQLREAPAPRLEPEELQRFLQLPESLPDDIRRAAEEVVADAESDYDRALTLQQWLRVDGRFEYNESAPGGTGINAIRAFLEERSGFCVHFASTMAVMARSLGIPARVSVGFLEGRIGSNRQTRVVNTDFAHAWPELYFEGAGWLPFEPTPPSQSGSAPEYATPRGAEIDSTGRDTAVPTASPAPTGEVGGSPNQDRNPREQDLLAGGGGAGPTDSGGGLPWPLVVGAVALVLLLASPALARVVMRRRRWRSATSPARTALAAWGELRATAVDLGFRVADSQTPRQLAAQLTADARLDEDGAAALTRVARAAERASYAPEVGEVGDLRDDVTTVRAGMQAVSSRGRRVRARLLPASTAALRHQLAERVADALDWTDRRSSELRARLSLRRAG